MSSSRLLRQDFTVVAKLLAGAAALGAALFASIVLVGVIGGISLNDIVPGLHLTQPHLQALSPEPFATAAAPKVPRAETVSTHSRPSSSVSAPATTSSVATPPAPVATPTELPMIEPSVGVPSPQSIVQSVTKPTPGPLAPVTNLLGGVLKGLL